MISRKSLIALTAALFVLTGCGAAGGDTAAGSTAGGTPSADAPSAKAGTATAAPSEDPCGTTAAEVEKHLRRPEVRSVTVEGQCTLAVIKTTLADAESGTAKQICDAAAEVAYTADTNSIRVLAKSGKELSVGITNAPCLAQP